MSRKDHPSYNSTMVKIPTYLNKYFGDNNFILIYPMQIGVSGDTNIDLKNPSILEPFKDNLNKLDDVGKTIANLFQRK
jgi:hypothetical protein